ncbi:hypothetical protein NM688_g2217 [Phlebia brevispora]|uniref:Uncharacterized protein n=1 Tax=Phlebia brevispora TaxID=194682 RepID=A0ACC1T954_9APHY|nr:hypothetical protein NM688_g2217 [Phlebia brevispora]
MRQLLEDHSTVVTEDGEPCILASNTRPILVKFFARYPYDHLKLEDVSPIFQDHNVAVDARFLVCFLDGSEDLVGELLIRSLSTDDMFGRAVETLHEMMESKVSQIWATYEDNFRVLSRLESEFESCHSRESDFASREITERIHEQLERLGDLVTNLGSDVRTLRTQWLQEFKELKRRIVDIERASCMRSDSGRHMLGADYVEDITEQLTRCTISEQPSSANEPPLGHSMETSEPQNVVHSSFGILYKAAEELNLSAHTLGNDLCLEVIPAPAGLFVVAKHDCHNASLVVSMRIQGRRSDPEAVVWFNSRGYPPRSKAGAESRHITLQCNSSRLSSASQHTHPTQSHVCRRSLTSLSILVQLGLAGVDQTVSNKLCDLSTLTSAINAGLSLCLAVVTRQPVHFPIFSDMDLLSSDWQAAVPCGPCPPSVQPMPTSASHLASGRKRAPYSVVTSHQQEEQPVYREYASAHPRRTIVKFGSLKFGSYLLLRTLGQGELGKVKLRGSCREAHSRRGSVEEASTSTFACPAGKSSSLCSVASGGRAVAKNRLLYTDAQTPEHRAVVRCHRASRRTNTSESFLNAYRAGSCSIYIQAHRYLHEKEACKLFGQLISGVWYIHQKKIVHRDLKL